jgi:signal peptidase I
MASTAQKADKKTDDGWWETVKIILQALVIAFVIRLFFFQPFNIPSGSMIPTLRVGDYLFVNKMSYGYGKYSFNFTAGFRKFKLFSVDEFPFIKSGRVLALGKPKRGDVVVFKLPRDNKTDYIKRLIGLPGDKIQVQNSVLYINGKAVPRKKIEDFIDTEHGGQHIVQFRETLPNGVTYITHNWTDQNPLDNTQVYTVPKDHYFMMGDNRDNSTDSRVLSHVGYVPQENLVGRATILFFSHKNGASFWRPWQWPWVIRWGRFFNLVNG